MKAPETSDKKEEQEEIKIKRRMFDRMSELQRSNKALSRENKNLMNKLAAQDAEVIEIINKLDKSGKYIGPDDLGGFIEELIAALKARNHIPQSRSDKPTMETDKTSVDSQSEQDERLSSGDYKMNPETDLRKQSGPASETGKLLNRRGRRIYFKNGGRRINKDGYVEIYSPVHPYKTRNNTVTEHRLVMEKHLGRYLLPTEVVHHINENRKDNRIENLEFLNSPGKHYSKYHSNKGKDGRFECQSKETKGCGKKMGYRHLSGAPAYCGDDVGTHIIYCPSCKARARQ